MHVGYLFGLNSWGKWGMVADSTCRTITTVGNADMPGFKAFQKPGRWVRKWGRNPTGRAEQAGQSSLNQRKTEVDGVVREVD